MIQLSNEENGWNMTVNKKSITILYADDDLDDQMLVRDAMQEARLANDLQFVNDGEELLDYLHNRGKFDDPEKYPTPGLILLDLNMPRLDGREALKIIKADPALRMIPIVVLTTSKVEEDILRSYNLGVNSFVVKPVTFSSLVEVVKSLAVYWFDIVQLPDLKSIVAHA